MFDTGDACAFQWHIVQITRELERCDSKLVLALLDSTGVGRKMDGLIQGVVLSTPNPAELGTVGVFVAPLSKREPSMSLVTETQPIGGREIEHMRDALSLGEGLGRI